MITIYDGFTGYYEVHIFDVIPETLTPPEAQFGNDSTNGCTTRHQVLFGNVKSVSCEVVQILADGSC